MCHVGYVYTYFPQAVFKFTDRECVVEVLGVFRVNGEGCHFAEVLASGNLFGRDFSRNLVGCRLYGLRIYIR